MSLTGISGRGRIHALLGPQGCGKSLIAAMLCHTKGICEGKKVISNTPFHFPDAQPEQVVKLTLDVFKENFTKREFWQDSIVYLDEPQNFLHSRTTMSHLNMAWAKFIPTIRHLNADFLYSTQRWMSVDVVLRDATSWKGVCEYHPELPCKRCKGSGIYKGLTCERCLGFKDPETQVCACGWAMVIFTPMRGYRIRKWIRVWGPDYFGTYDTLHSFSVPVKALNFDTAEVF
jgi:hypothetical protein